VYINSKGDKVKEHKSDG